MDENESLSHRRWECKYHVIFISKCRRKTLYKELRQHLGEVFRRLAELTFVAAVSFVIVLASRHLISISAEYSPRRAARLHHAR